jgi:hypothetical protein
MVNRPANPRATKHISFQLGDDEYAEHVSSAQFTPSSSSIEWRGSTPAAVFTDTSSSTWVFAVNVVQDWETPGSLANFLLAHEGEKVDVVLKPEADGEFAVTAEVTIVPPAIGGAVNAFNESTVTMGSTKPVPTFPTP